VCVWVGGVCVCVVCVVCVCVCVCAADRTVTVYVTVLSTSAPYEQSQLTKNALRFFVTKTSLIILFRELIALEIRLVEFL